MLKYTVTSCFGCVKPSSHRVQICQRNCTALYEIILISDVSIFVISVTFINYDIKKENIKNIIGENTFHCVPLESLTVRFNVIQINPLTPNDPYRGRTAPLTSKRCILYIYSTNIGTEYFKHGIYSPYFLFKMQFVSSF